MRIRIAGVPEHYNEPWVQAIKNGSFAKIGLDVVFEPVPEGTGRLIEGLKSNQWDIAMALTEGLIKDIANGSNLRLFGTFVESPLCWAVSVGAQRSDLCGVAQLKGTRIGISRFTSGSHLMACVMAAQNGWSHQDDLTFVVNHNFKRKCISFGCWF
jgi:ABC-type nitrate/sulfonate/bicarbonate transport system substrate-binding protein